MDVDLIELQLDVKNDQDAIYALGQTMLDKGYVKNTYVDAVLKSEKNLPTGLDLGNLCVAIPHTDEGKHVNTSHIAVGILKYPVQFGSMIDPQDKLNVCIVFLLAIKEPDVQLSLLKQLMSAFKNVELLKEIQVADKKEKVKALIDDIMPLEIIETARGYAR